MGAWRLAEAHQVGNHPLLLARHHLAFAFVPGLASAHLHHRLASVSAYSASVAFPAAASFDSVETPKAHQLVVQAAYSGNRESWHVRAVRSDAPVGFESY